MVILDEVKRRLSELAPEVTDLHDALAIERSRVRLEELEQKSASPEFYDDAAASGAVFAEMGELKDRLEQYAALQTMLEDSETLLEMCAEDDDPALAEEADAAVNSLDAKVEELRLVTLLNGEYDANNAILTFHAGAGGTEAQDWSSMLTRMYLRWAEARGFKTEIIEESEGEVAGLKSVTIKIIGDYAYGWLRTETGVHRLVRKSPFDSGGRRHTSFSSAFVYPEVDEDIDIEINPADLRIDVYRASGAGGQHVNRTESAVRITHIPTGLVTQCQNDRSQHKNKDQAMKQMKAKLYELEMQKKNAEKQAMEDNKSDIGWGSQIRSYVLDDSRIKDLRTGVETRNTQAVLDGSLDQFIEASLKAGL